MKPTRREFIRALGAGATGLAVQGCTRAVLAEDGASSFANRRPNIILVMTDDQGYGDLSCHGSPILPCLENEGAVGPEINPFKALYWEQFGGGPRGGRSQKR